MQAPLLQQRGMQPLLSIGGNTKWERLPVGLAAGPAESPSPGPGLTPDLAPNEGRKTAAVSICRDGTKKPGTRSKKEKNKRP